MTYHDVETLSRERLRDRQREHLKRAGERASDVALYRERFADADLEPGDLTHETLPDLAFTTKADFRDTYPDGLFAVPREDLRRVHASSGTTGKPKVVAYTEGDLRKWRELGSRSLYAAGCRPGDTVQNACGYGLFTGGLGWHDAIEALDACVVPAGGGNTSRQVDLIRDLEVSGFVCMPSYALYLADHVRDRGGDPRDLPITYVPVGAEASTEAMREEIAEAFDAVVTENYGLTELYGPGVATECAAARDGMHVWEDHFLVEVVDPDTGERVPDGTRGELVLTGLQKEAVPVLRYRTGDVVERVTDTCECGRTHSRIRVVGRSDDLLVVRGVNVYPTEIEHVLLEFDALAPQYRIDVDRQKRLDTIEVTVEVDPARNLAAPGRNALANDVTDRLSDVLGLTPDEVDVVPPDTIDRTEVGKVKRVHDHRES
ncbi:phenylacetate--CoA ligase [Halorubellus litoreus]|uniref:Phenylacetate--CoA ligase n=1 Tax=Halorubellus litoreus TaxID=755308 RepID=A0ABD5VC80_9EURY